MLIYNLEYSDLELLQEDTVELLWAGKELHRGKRLCDYIGKNEKTKVHFIFVACSVYPFSNTSHYS